MSVKSKKTAAEIKVYDEKVTIAAKRGNGLLRREVWQDHKGRVTRYNLAYINPHVFPGDNGRVIGYDNAHGYHHKHFFGRMILVDDFKSFEDIEDRFQRDWTSLKREKSWQE